MQITESFINKLINFGNTLSEKIVSIQNRNPEVYTKEDNSPLTEADILSNKLIREFLSKNSEVTSFISEEEKLSDFNMRKNWEYFWVIDPIDGTKEFVKGGSDYCVNIALCRGSKPVFGYVLVPKTKTHYYAIEHLGAFKNGKLIECSQSINDGIKIVASKSHLNKDTENFIKILESLDKFKLNAGGVETVNVGSSLKLCLVAEGKADVYPRYGPTMEWDTCAPHIILQEAGGEIYQAQELGIHPCNLTYFMLNKKPALVYNKESLLNPYFICYSKAFAGLFNE